MASETENERSLTGSGQMVARDLSHSGQRVTTAPPEPRNRSGKPTAPLTGAPRADATLSTDSTSQNSQE